MKALALAVLLFSASAQAKGWEIYFAKGFEKASAILEIESASGGMKVSVVRVAGATPEILEGVQRILFKGDVAAQEETQTIKVQTFEIQEERAVTAPIAPAIAPGGTGQTKGAISGAGDQLSTAFPLKAGLRKFTWSASGTGHFAIKLLTTDGDHVELIANELNATAGSKGVKIRNDGDYHIEVSSSGRWSVSIE